MSETNIDDIQKVFEHTMIHYVQIRKEKLLDIEKYIIIGDEIDKIIIGGKTLIDLIKGIEDNDLKKACFSYFCQRDNVNLMDYNYKDKSIEDSILGEILDMNYHNGKPALYSAIACLNSWILFSFPIEKEWRNATIVLDSDKKTNSL